MHTTTKHATLACVLATAALVAHTGAAFAQGATAIELTTKHEGNVYYPQLSPDGKKIAYEVNYPADKRTELYWVGFSGRALEGTAEPLVPESMGAPSRYGGGKRITHMFAWAAPGGAYPYAYTVNNAEGLQQIYVNNWPYLIDKEGESVNKEPAWDPKNPRFVFTSNRTGNGDIYLWDGGEELQMTYDDIHAELYPYWAPDGSNKVAFVQAGKAESQVMVLDVNLFSSVKLVDFGGADSTRPSYSPDGSKIAFLSNKGQASPQEFGLWVVEARGGTPRMIGPRVALPSKGAASWTPDGKGVLAVIEDPDKGDPIAIFPIDGGAPRVLPTGTYNNRDPQLRVLDGQWRMVFTSQGLEAKKEKTWQRLFVYDIPR